MESRKRPRVPIGPGGGGAVCSAVPVRIEIFINLTRVFGSSPSLYMPHGVPSEIRALVSAKYAGLEIAKIIRYSQLLCCRYAVPTCYELAPCAVLCCAVLCLCCAYESP